MLHNTIWPVRAEQIGTTGVSAVADGAWLYPVSLPSGGYAVMLKTLMSNTCVNDCKYCPYRDSTDVRRCSIGPDEMARIFFDYVQKKDVYGLFLSSGVVRTPDHTMHLLNDTAQILRDKTRIPGIYSS